MTIRHLFTLTVIRATQSLTAQAPPVTAAYQDLYDTLTTQLAGFDAVVNASWNGSSYAVLEAPQLEAADSNRFTPLLGTNYYAYAVAPQLKKLQALNANAIVVYLNFCQSFYTFIRQPRAIPAGMRTSVFS